MAGMNVSKQVHSIQHFMWDMVNLRTACKVLQNGLF